MTPALVYLALAVASAPVSTPAQGVADSPWLYAIGSGGLVAILGWASKLYLDLRSGKAQANEARAADLILQRDTAWKERDEARRRERAADRRADVEARRGECEARNARRVLDYAARLRRRLVYECGVTDVEPEPELFDCGTVGEGEDDPGGWGESAPDRPRTGR